MQLLLSNFVANLKRIRKLRNKSRAEMAKLLGIPFGTYSCYESGSRCPSLKRFLRLCTTLSVEPNELLIPQLCQVEEVEEVEEVEQVEQVEEVDPFTIAFEDDPFAKYNI